MKIKMFQSKLKKIRSAAFWLDQITQAHTDDHKKRRSHITEAEENMRFMNEKLMQEKVNR